MSNKNIVDKQLQRVALEVRLENLNKKIQKIRIREGNLTIKNVQLKDRIQELIERLHLIEDHFEKSDPPHILSSSSLPFEEKTHLIHRELEDRIFLIKENLRMLHRRKIEIKERAEALISRSKIHLNRE